MKLRPGVAFALAALSVLLVASSGCSYYQTSDGGSGTPPANTIWITNYKFNPSTLTVSAGTTVTWINKDSVAHTVTSPGNFDSGNIAAGGQYT
ncbi:MAG: amidase, partial [Candidatus Thermoplasmatota archaeon]|nr:amidase [Candidatus Thermoplasmatota archaeon]